MKKTLVGSILVAVIAMGGCRDRASSGNDSETKVGAEPIPTSVEPSHERGAKSEPFDPAKLASSVWTRQACSLDMVDRGAPDADVARGKSHSFEGFVLGADGAAAGQFLVVFKGEKSFAVQASTGVSRPDVAAYFKNPALGNAGFMVSSDLAAADPGVYEIYFYIVNGTGTFFCEAGRKVIVS